MSQELLSVDALLRDEDQRMQGLHRDLEQIINSAAAKLAANLDDKTQISSILSKKWPEQTRTIQRTLPPEYKMAPTTQEVPKTQLTEIIYLLSDALTELNTWVKQIIKKCESEPGFEEKLSKQVAGVATFDAILKDVKELNSEVSTIKQITDEREFITSAAKILMRLQLRSLSLRNIAQQAGITDKWFKSDKFDSQSKLSKQMNMVKDLVAKAYGNDFSLQTWLTREYNRLIHGMEVEFPQIAQ